MGREEVTGILLAGLAALVVVLVKFLICYCLERRRRLDDSRPILPRSESVWIEYERLRVMRSEPPPDFDEALRSSVPISYIEVDERPPPSYEDYMTIYSTSNNGFEDNFVDLSLTSLPDNSRSQTNDKT